MNLTAENDRVRNQLFDNYANIKYNISINVKSEVNHDWNKRTERIY